MEPVQTQQPISLPGLITGAINAAATGFGVGQGIATRPLLSGRQPGPEQFENPLNNLPGNHGFPDSERAAIVSGAEGASLLKGVSNRDVVLAVLAVGAVVTVAILATR